MRKWFAILLVLVFIGASTQCLAECAGQVCKEPPCHKHSQPKCSIESQLVASAPDSVQHPATLIEAGNWSLQPALTEHTPFNDSRFERTAPETPPRLTVLRV